MELRRFLVILTIALIIILATVAWFLPPNEDFRADNPFWNGTKSTSSSLPAAPLESLSDLPSVPQGTTLILIPYLDFTQAELDELHQFVSQGGTLFLADDYGFGNQVLEYLGLKARFSGQVLTDPMFYHRKILFPRIFHLTPSPITSNVDSLILNHAPCLIDVEGSDVLALSSSVSFLDLSGDSWYNEGEPTGPLPVISHHNLGSGQIILISDPSVFINSMQDMEDNQTFLQNIAATTTGELLISQSHLPPSNLHHTKTLLAAIRNLLITPLGKVGLVVLALTVTLIPIWRKKEEKQIT